MKNAKCTNTYAKITKEQVNTTINHTEQRQATKINVECIYWTYILYKYNRFMGIMSIEVCI